MRRENSVTRDLEMRRRRLVVERLLHNLEASECRDDFAIRGAWAFVVWHGELHRETRALDISYLGSEEPETALRAACVSTGPLAIHWSDHDVAQVGDGWTERTRIQVHAHQKGREFDLAVNVARNVGDLAHVERRRFRGRNPVAPALVGCLSPEWLVAEKAALLVTYGPDHTRLQDLLDLWILNRRFEFDQRSLVEAFLKVSMGRDAERMVRRRDGYWEAALDPIGRSRLLFQRWDSLTAQTFQFRAPGLQKVLVEVGAFLWPILTHVRDRDLSAPSIRPAAGRQTRTTMRDMAPTAQAVFAF